MRIASAIAAFALVTAINSPATASEKVSGKPFFRVPTRGERGENGNIRYCTVPTEPNGETWVKQSDGAVALKLKPFCMNDETFFEKERQDVNITLDGILLYSRNKRDSGGFQPPDDVVVKQEFMVYLKPSVRLALLDAGGFERTCNSASSIAETYPNKDVKVRDLLKRSASTGFVWFYFRSNNPC